MNKVFDMVQIIVQYSGHSDKNYDKNLSPRQKKLVNRKKVNLFICHGPQFHIVY